MLIEDYVKLFPFADYTFAHVAKQQWLISFIIGTKGYNIIEIPYHIHCHGHFGLPVGADMDENDVATYNGNVILFKHLPGWSYWLSRT
jgi:hypothetical protein